MLYFRFLLVAFAQFGFHRKVRCVWCTTPETSGEAHLKEARNEIVGSSLHLHSENIKELFHDDGAPFRTA